MTLKEVDSTNNYLKSMLSNSEPVAEGTVIMAEAQFAGRGQQNNTWHAQPGKNLTFTILLNPSFLEPLKLFDLTRTISLGVYDALQPLLGEKLRIKWPNDIYYGDRKLGGMLIENMIQGRHIRHVVVGIGININQDNFPNDAGAPISVKQILQRDYDLKEILSELCSRIEAWYLRLKAGRLEEIRSNYLNILYRLNEPAQFRSNGELFTGIITGVTDAGLLNVMQTDGLHQYNLKEIEFLKQDT